MREILFHPSLWMVAAGLAVAAGLFFYGNSRLLSTIRNAGLAIFGLVMVWCVAAYFVQTPIEQCITRTHAIVAAVESGDWKGLETKLDPNTTLEMFNGARAIAGATELAASSYGLKNIRVFGTEAMQGVGSIDVSFSAILEGAQPTTSNWRFEYEERSDGLLLARIVPISIGQMSADQLRGRMR